MRTHVRAVVIGGGAMGVGALLAAGADPSKADKDGTTATNHDDPDGSLQIAIEVDMNQEASAQYIDRPTSDEAYSSRQYSVHSASSSTLRFHS